VHTAGFSVYRLRRSSYSPAELKSLRARLRRAGRRGPVFAYRKHEQEPDGALEAERLLGELAPGAGGPA
jgi:uncharacterized protein YecE (DUF72 family)